MAQAKLKFGENEIVLGHGVTTLGRTTDNNVSFSTDSNVSRNHAEIKWRDGDFWLSDLGSSNGTKLNNAPVEWDRKLKDGDEILLGGSSRVVFTFGDQTATPETDYTATTDSTFSEPISEEASLEQKEESAVVSDTQAVSKAKTPLMLGIAGAACGLAVIAAVGAGIYTYTGSSKCEATAVIVKPDNGETITEPTEIEVELQNAECVERAIFLINGAEFADSTEQPFTANLDPKKFPELANGSLQSLRIVLQDTEGNKIVQPTEVALQFETIEIATPTPTPEIAAQTTPTPGKSGAKVSGADTQEMAKNLVKQFSGTFNYKFDTQFLQEVSKKTGEYASEGFSTRANAYKDVISVSFVQERNLDAPLAFILAMSRSQFKPQKNGADEGLWQMSAEFAAQNSYNGLCGTETLSDPTQNCAAKVASLYLKSLVLEVFEGDVIYSVASFGKSPQEANIWKTSLPADRADFWNVIKDAKQREQIVKFFAAGIVAENPQKFNLKKDRPISEIYKSLIGN